VCVGVRKKKNSGKSSPEGKKVFIVGKKGHFGAGLGRG